MEAPKHAYELTIKTGAHTLDGLLINLSYMIFDLERGSTHCASGSPDGSYDMLLTIRPEMNKDRYHRELNAYIEYLDEQKRKDQEGKQ